MMQRFGIIINKPVIVSLDTVALCIQRVERIFYCIARNNDCSESYHPKSFRSINFLKSFYLKKECFMVALNMIVYDCLCGHNVESGVIIDIDNCKNFVVC